MDKPDGCKGCPLYGDGKGFVPGSFPVGATVLVLGQNPGAEEEKVGIPLVGKTGQLLDRTFLPLAGLDGQEIAKDNVIRCRWTPPGKKEKTNDLPSGKVLDAAITHCRQYDKPGDGFRLVIAMGGIAVKKMAGSDEFKIHNWRGFLLPERGKKA